ncbi:MAG: hypothetical protein ACRC3I_03290 [Cetobacterium sp.]
MKKYILLFLKLCSVTFAVQGGNNTLNKNSYDINIIVKGNVVSDKVFRTPSTLSSVISSDGSPSIIITDKNGNEISVIRFDENINNNGISYSEFYFYTNFISLNNSNFSEQINYNFKNNSISSINVNNPKEKILNTLAINFNSFDNNGILHHVVNSISTTEKISEGFYVTPSAVLEFFYLKNKFKLTKEEGNLYD